VGFRSRPGPNNVAFPAENVGRWPLEFDRV
jgi:hypothetical protein